MENDGRKNRRVTQKQPFADVFEMGALKNFVIFAGKQV